MSKKTKNIFISFLFLLGIFLVPKNVMASDWSGGIWNGGSSTVAPGTGSGCPKVSPNLCYFNNGNHLTYKVSLYFFSEGGGREQIGNSVIFSTNDFQNMGFTKSPVNAGSNSKLNVAVLREYFENNAENFWGLLPYLNTSQQEIYQRADEFYKATNKLPSLPAVPSGSYTSYGYRLIVEPVISFYRNGKITFYTSKELATSGENLTNSARWEDVSWIMHTNFDDVYIKAFGAKTTSRDSIGNIQNGYGYNIYDVSTFINKLVTTDGDNPTNPPPIIPPPPVCELVDAWEIKTKGTPQSCDNTNENNDATYTQYAVKVRVCKDKVDNIKYFESPKGRYIRTVGTYCKLYCYETATTSYPGNIAESLTLGTKLVWPTSSTNKGNWSYNQFSLTMKGTMTCQFDYAPDSDNEEDIANIKNPKKAYDKIMNTLIPEQQKIIDENQSASEASCPDICTGCCNASSKNYSTITAKPLNGPGGASDPGYVPSGPGHDGGSSGGSGGSSGGGSSGGSSDDSDDSSCSPSYGTDTDCVNNRQAAKDAIANARAEIERLRKEADAIAKAMWNCLSSSFDEEDIDIYQFKTSATIRYNDPDYGTSTQLKKQSEDSSCTGCDYNGSLTENSSFDQLYNAANNRKIKITKTVEFGLTDNLYRYINKTNNESVLSKPSDTSDYYDVGYSNLPISFQASLNKSYSLYVSGVTLGHKGQFTNLANKKSYVCKYNVTTASQNCICPEGTKHEGEDLYCKIVKENKNGANITCPDGQVKWCDGDTNVDYDDEYCPPQDYYCPNDKTMNISSCVLGGQSFDWCVEKLCNKGSKYECPSNTPNWHMDISNCVYTKVAQGYTLQQAILACEQVMCPANGLNIIYRTINLANPFPGKDIDQRIPGFNYDVLGRYPGTNWNGKTLVAKEILNNRGVKADSLYNKDVTPLYTITLDPKIIGKIRAYNKQQMKNDDGYSDFTLECKKGTSCISKEFLRGILGNYVTGGTCKNVTHSDFYKCSEVKS